MAGNTVRDEALSVCAVCLSVDNHPLYRGLVQCESCGFVWFPVSTADLNRLNVYRDEYFHGGSYPDYLTEEHALRRSFRDVLHTVRRFAPSGKLLEVGCAYGFFLDSAKAYFDVVGIDVNSTACTVAQERFGVRTIAGDFLACDFSKSQFDVVVCLATLEHLARPDLYVEKLSRLIKPGGYSVCWTIDRDALFARLSGRFWRYIYPPEHLSYFSHQTLALLLKRFGLHICFWKRPFNYRNLDVVMRKLSKSRFTEWLYTALDRSGVIRREMRVPFRDDILVIARKSLHVMDAGRE